MENDREAIEAFPKFREAIRSYLKDGVEHDIKAYVRYEEASNDILRKRGLDRDAINYKTRHEVEEEADKIAGYDTLCLTYGGIGELFCFQNTSQSLIKSMTEAAGKFDIDFTKDMGEDYEIYAAKGGENYVYCAEFTYPQRGGPDMILPIEIVVSKEGKVKRVEIEID